MSVRCALFDWSDVVEKVSKQKLNTATLIFIFLIGLFLVIWPVVTELTSYQVDEDEYEAIAAELRPDDPSPVPALPVTEPTDQPTEEPVQQQPVETVDEPTDVPLATEPVTEQPTADPPVTEQPVTEQPVTPSSSEIPEEISTPEPVQEVTAAPVSTATGTPTAIPENKPTPTAVPVKPTEQPQAGVDLAACLAQNHDFVAWITIPGTKIDYPVVRSDNTEYYLHHLFTGKESKLGSLFSLKSSDYQTPSKNIAIYGHHLSQSDAMFSTLLKYKGASYCDSHSMIQLDTLYGYREYRIFAVVNMNVSDWDAATASFSSSDSFMHFVNRAKRKALYDTGVQVSEDDYILTLITCDRSFGGVTGRLIVMAVQQ